MKDEDFNQIKQSLVDEFKEIKNEVKGMRADMNRLFETTQFHDVSLYGNKKDNTSGVMDDVRTLKSEYAERKKHMAWVWTAVILSAIERAFHYVSGK